MQENAIRKLHSRHPRMSMAQRFYTEENVYQRDIRWLRENMWWIVGHESQVLNSGDYFLYEFDKDSVIVIRDHEGQIRVHHNVCRHRGSRICVKSNGTLRLLACPYHAWSYDLDGKLRAVPVTAQNFDKTRYTLAACQVRVHCGLIFLSFAEAPPDFGAYIDCLTRELELQDIQHSKIAGRYSFNANANWKLVVQNNLECYHCGPAHPTYCAAHPGAPFARREKNENQTPYERASSILRDSDGEKKRHFTPVNPDHDATNFQFLLRDLIGEGCSTESLDGKPVAPLMGRNTYEGVQTFGLTSPLTSVVLNPDYAVIYSFTPRSVRRTDVEVIWLVTEIAVEGVDFDFSRVAAVWEPTLREDKSLAENTQLGVDSSAYRPGPYSRSEMMVSEFDRWYLRRVGA